MAIIESPQHTHERQVHTTTTSSRYTPDAVIAAFVGLVLLVVGLIVITRGGFDGPMSEPVVRVFGFTYTTTLGLIEIVIGVCLLLSGATRSRSGELFFGTVLGIAGFVGASVLLLPRFAKSSTTVTQN